MDGKNSHDKIAVWLKLVPDLTPENIPEKHNEVYEAITTHYTNLNTIKSHLSVLAKCIRNVDPENYKRYSKMSTELNRQVEKQNQLLNKIDFFLTMCKR